MNISLSWLKQYIDFQLTPEGLADALTSIGLETGSVERVESIRGGLRGIVVGKVLTCEPHPNSDHLHITTVDLGDGTPTQIVCGAPNVAAGQTVVVATVGTTLYDGDKEFAIKKSKIRGVESFGMICAEDEIGVGQSHDGIIVLPDNVHAGTPAAEYYNLTDDYVLEVDLTPNRIDAASHYGVARDLAAWLACHATPSALKRPSVEAFTADRQDGATDVQVDNTAACPRYTGVTIRGVKVQESPKWLKDKLNAIGQRPINNIVDITNYILHGIGQPLHCFDLERVKGGRIVVRNCPEGTPFVTLDGIERKLSEADLMICDAEKPMCIAGVFGGIDSGVTDSTTSIFLESAYFNPTSIRKSARRHGLNTDASFRYERGLDPNACVYALKLAALMIKEIAGGEICGEIVDIYPQEVKPFPVTLSYAGLDTLVGKHIPSETVDSILRSLEIDILRHNADGTADLLVPTYRVDVTRPCDVIEDVLRIYGYNNVEFPGSLHASLSFKTLTDNTEDIRRTIAGQLTAAGFNEILNNSLTAARYYTGLTTYPEENCVRLLNPLSNDLNAMRQSLIFGGLESLGHNINRKNADLMFYETGNVYFFNPAVQPDADKPLAPYSEASRLALWITGKTRTGNWARPAEEATVYDLRAHVDNILARLGISTREIAFTPEAPADIFSAGLTLATRSGKALGHLGIVADPLLKAADIKQPIYFAELDLMALVKLAMGRKVTYSPLPKTMTVERDLALLLDSSVTFGQVKDVVCGSERRLLRDVTLFDVYEGKNLPAGKKSYAISISLRDDEKTLQDKAIEQVMKRIIDNLKSKLGAELR